MRYKISYEKRALRELNKLPRKAVDQIIKRIDSLEENPYRAGVRKLSLTTTCIESEQVTIELYMKFVTGNCAL